MLLVSSHVFDCGEIRLPPEAIVRVNMAWVPSLKDLSEKLARTPHDVFLDNPIGRSKPPAHRYSLEETVEFIKSHPQIKYLAVSNVESHEDVFPFNRAVPKDIKIVPKIETIKGVQNIGPILCSLGGPDNVIMLDHDDLCADLIRNGVDPALMYTDYINPLLSFCKSNGADVLRTQGVVFSTEH
jgi:hypothetical protein